MISFHFQRGNESKRVIGLPCPVHKAEIMEFFCDVCDQLTCRDCQLHVSSAFPLSITVNYSLRNITIAVFFYAFHSFFTFSNNCMWNVSKISNYILCLLVNIIFTCYYSVLFSFQIYTYQWSVYGNLVLTSLSLIVYNNNIVCLFSPLKLITEIYLPIIILLLFITFVDFPPHYASQSNLWITLNRCSR